MISKKSQSAIKPIVVTIMSAAIFITFILILSQFSHLTIDEKKMNSQLVLSKLFSGKCFSDDFATFKESKFTKESLNTCYSNINEKTMFRIKIPNKTNYLYSGSNEEEFNQKKAYCNLDSNVLCTRLLYPITFIDNSNKYSSEQILVEIISS